MEGALEKRVFRFLVNGSDQVGRNLMKLQLTSILQLATEANSGRYGRSDGINDYLWGDQNVSFPLGSIQNGGGVLQDALFAESPPVLSLVTKLLPNFGLQQLAARSISWWAMSTVLPDPHRVSLRGDRIQITNQPNNREAHDRLVYRWIDSLKSVVDLQGRSHEVANLTIADALHMAEGLKASLR
jgi:hypothetical protein